MYTLNLSHMNLAVDFAAGHIQSLVIHGKERLAKTSPLFEIRLRDKAGNAVMCNAYEAASRVQTEDGGEYRDFPIEGLSVRVFLTETNGAANWRISLSMDNADYFAEWVDFPLVKLPALKDNNALGTGGQMLLPYNEGVLLSDSLIRRQTDFRHWDMVYPSIGCYFLFPNMISSQMMAYLWEDAGLYLGVHDPDRSVKGIDFDGDETATTLIIRLFCGTDFGEPFTTDYPIVWAVTDGRWESAAERYRTWFENHLPPRAVKIKDNPTLPEWYADAPLIVSYPVRGKFDTDDMAPNALYPYTNALPLLDKIRQETQSRLLVLLMHWEGTAPWAPPYVWPPYGGEENFNAFKDALHSKHDMLGVYCSGFGYTLQSRLVDDYNCEEDYKARHLEPAMCAAPDGHVEISKICTAQRSGYDICPASPLGKALLTEAYTPLFENGLDYAQILDQNHGGGQYFCYSRDHGHAPGPGKWMTQNMQNMLSEWNKAAPGMLFGCESAAAEPFIGNLLFSDNRYELNYFAGTPVPLYAYLYHEYLRNFMGNQVCCPFPTDMDTLSYRIAYSFAAGDCMTLVLTPDGELMSHWGLRDFSHLPDRDTTLSFIANLTRFYREKAKDYLFSGRMIPASPVVCDTVGIDLAYPQRRVILPAVFSSAWESEDGRRARVLVNPQTTDVVCKVDGHDVTVPARDAVLLEM